MPCWYCGIRLKKSGPAMKTKDHVVPKSQGGIWTVDACLKCNQRKADMSVDAFRRLCGGIEFFGEMRERLVNEATSWIVEGPQDTNVVHNHPRSVVPYHGDRVVHVATVDLSRIKQYTRGAKTKQEKKHKGQENNFSTSHIPPDLVGVKVGVFTVLRRLTGKWEVECICGAIEHRSSKAVLNPANTFDACVDCRIPVQKLRSDIFKEFGVDVTWEDCFQYIYEPHLETMKENYGTVD